jgi:hypothetical protein
MTICTCLFNQISLNVLDANLTNVSSQVTPGQPVVPFSTSVLRYQVRILGSEELIKTSCAEGIFMQ